MQNNKNWFKRNKKRIWSMLLDDISESDAVLAAAQAAVERATALLSESNDNEPKWGGSKKGKAPNRDRDFS
jgi:hypothetical protein